MMSRRKREAAEEMGSLMTSEEKSDVSQSGGATGDVRQASVMMSEGQRRVTVAQHWERKRWMRERDRQTGVVQTCVFTHSAVDL